MSVSKQRMSRGELYIADDPELTADRSRAQTLLERFNTSTGEQHQDRTAILRRLVGSMGDGVVVSPSFRCDYGFNIHIGADTFVNYDCVMLDVVPITIGVACQIGPRVQLLAATHPVDPVARRTGWESGAPITDDDRVAVPER